MVSAKIGDPDLGRNLVYAETQVVDPFHFDGKIDRFAKDTTVEKSIDAWPSKAKGQTSKETAVSELKQVKGALPQGFFDDKDADLRARGITPVKPDVK